MYCRHNAGNEEAIQDLLYCSYYTNPLYSDCCYTHSTMSTSQEFIDFMVGNNKTGKKKNKIHIDTTRPSTVFTPNSFVTPNRNTEFPSPSVRKIHPQKSSYVIIVKAFSQAMIEWIEIDDQIGNIMQSVTNLRERIWHTSQLLNVMATAETVTSTMTSSWKQGGYRSDRSCHLVLQAKDLQLTVDHNLQHHERMIREMRHLISSENNIQEKLSRRFDELYRADVFELGVKSNLNRSCDTMELLSVEFCQILLVSMAKELYRKQCLVLQILNTSTVDSLLSTEDRNVTTMLPSTKNTTTETNDPIRNPRLVAQRCSSQWSWSSKSSYLFVYVKQIKEILLQQQLK
jgi:hypothetical protein